MSLKLESFPEESIKFKWSSQYGTSTYTVKNGLPFSPPHTVTRIDVIFGYPDRVPLTHFVHRTKNVFAMWA
jgi:hypothetical protein